MATVIRITPVQEVVNVYDQGEFKPQVRRRCVQVKDYRDYKITYDGNGRRVLEARV